jgi:hypothetical protein
VSLRSLLGVTLQDRTQNERKEMCRQYGKRSEQVSFDSEKGKAKPVTGRGSP